MPSGMAGEETPRFTDPKPQVAKENSQLLCSIMSGSEINMKLWHRKCQQMVRVHLLVSEQALNPGTGIGVCLNVLGSR